VYDAHPILTTAGNEVNKHSAPSQAWLPRASAAQLPRRGLSRARGQE